MNNLDTESRIIFAATKLFAEKGFDGVSIREILELAEANIASVHYYFGSKEELYHAAARQFAPAINEKRRAALNEIRRSSGFTVDSVDAILRAYTKPHFAVAREFGGEDYMRMFSRFHTEPRADAIAFYETHFGRERKAFFSALAQALAPIDKDDLRRGFSFFVSSMLGSPADVGYIQLTGNPKKRIDFDRLEEQLVTFHSAGLRALSRKEAA